MMKNILFYILLSFVALKSFSDNKLRDSIFVNEKRIFKASDGNIYARYFDGTNDVNVLIP